MTDLLVYTMAIGFDYELPLIKPYPGVHWVCLTDRNLQESKGWSIQKISPQLPEDLFRTSRIYKTSPHIFFKQYSVSIYIDTRVTLKDDPRILLRTLLPTESHILGGFYHSYRKTLADEFVEIAKEKLDFHSVLNEHLNLYKVYFPEQLAIRPVWGGILARRHMEDACILSMELWKSHILRYSRRDQLSLPWAIRSMPEHKVNLLSLSIFDSDFHKWPTGSDSKPNYQTLTFSG